MGFAEYHTYDATGLAHLVRRGEVSPLELLEEAITRIERHNGALNAVVYKAYDEARKTAGGKLPDGPFKAVPFLIKDLSVPVAGWRMTNGTAWMKDYVTAQDCELTKRYRASGMVLMGKTNTPEFGIPGTTEGRHLGPCRNPWNTDHSSGGSSGGAAAAVASGMVPMAHASDGMGSIRIPAAQCGLVGLKPTYGRNPGGPDDRNRVHGFSVDHVVTRTMRDAAAMLDWTGYAEDDAPYAPPPKTRLYTDELTARPGKLRIAFTTEVPRETPPHPDVQNVFDNTVKLLGELGHTMIEIPKLGIEWRKIYKAQGAIAAAVLAATIEHWTTVLGREPTEDDFEPLAWEAYQAGKSVSGVDAARGLQTLRLMSRDILSKWRDFDILLSPTTLTPPPKIGHLDPVNVAPRDFNRRQSYAFGYTPPCNMTGQPALSLPLGLSSDGLPIGMMFAGRYGDEATLIRLGAQLEEAAPWSGRHAKIWG
jgi:amidase